MRSFAGPECLGRSVLVAVGQPAPQPWEGCLRVPVCLDPPNPDTGRRLRAAWLNRERLVIELDGPLPDHEPVLERSWWELQPGLTLRGEVWHHLLTSNAVDARNPDQPRFAPRDRALELGAGDIAADDPDDPGDLGDIVTATGPAWCDGGPLQTFEPTDLGGVPLIPAANLAAGRLKALRPCEPVAELASDQRRAVGHLGGGACIVAPAGSGKTRVLTERVRWLVRDLGVAASSVCLVAYNVRARAEMQERTGDLDGLEVRTLNSLALAVCNGSGPFARPRGHGRVGVINESEARDILHDLVGERSPRRRRRAMTDPLAAWLEALTALRLGLRSPVEVERDFHPDVPGFAETAPAYAEVLQQQGVVDFDHQIVRAIDVLLTDPVARAAARRTCGVLLVDEFQDLTPAHLLMIRLLAGPRADVFGVGDDDQTIYGYSGASPRWLVEYERWFPGAVRHLLHVNYRCPPAVVKAAANLLSHNQYRIVKDIDPRSDHPDPKGGQSVDVTASNDGGSAVVERVRALMAQGADASDIAVLTRVNSTLLAPQILLSEAGIECMTPVGPWFLERTGVAAALAWLRLATCGPARLPASALATAARRPPRGISPRVVEWIAEQRNVGALRRLAGRISDERTAQRVADFADDVESLGDLARSGADTLRLLEAVRDGTQLGVGLDERLDASRRSVDRSAHGDDLRALLSVAPHCDDPAGFEEWLTVRLTRHRGQGDGDGDTDEGIGSLVRPSWGRGVRLATVHRVKGLEWPHVIVLSASEGLMPHRLAGDLEEERRVFHVALTRCSESLLVIADGSRSRFVDETAWRSKASRESQPENQRAANATLRCEGQHETDATLRPESQQVLPTTTASDHSEASDDLEASDDPEAPAQLFAASAAEPSSTGSRSSRRAQSPPIDEAAEPEAAEMFERLRAWRSEQSKAQQVPAYVVFSDDVLRHLARLRPTSDGALLAVPGIGSAKLAAYGTALKALLTETP